MTSNSSIVTAFIDIWTSKEIDAIMDFFAADAVYTNIPMDPPNEGLEAIRTTINGFIDMATEIEFIVHHQAENAQGVVMNERTDRFLIGDKWVDLPVMGVFELHDGKIAKWRDYFDMGQFTNQM